MKPVVGDIWCYWLYPYKKEFGRYQITYVEDYDGLRVGITYLDQGRDGHTNYLLWKSLVDGGDWPDEVSIAKRILESYEEDN
jgi:hypothetical protein